jgi:hypothetical protein
MCMAYKGIRSSPFHLMKLILSISNEKLRFKVDASNGVYEINVGMSFKNLNNTKLFIPLNASTLNNNYKLNSINFI